MEIQTQCVFCYKTLPPMETKVSRNEECPFCYGSLHSCKACQFFDQSAYNECREPMAERIIEKNKANFCDYFTLVNEKNSQDQKEDLLKAAQELFKKK